MKNRALHACCEDERSDTSEEGPDVDTEAPLREMMTKAGGRTQLNQMGVLEMLERESTKYRSDLESVLTLELRKGEPLASANTSTSRPQAIEGTSGP